MDSFALLALLGQLDSDLVSDLQFLPAKLHSKIQKVKSCHYL